MPHGTTMEVSVSITEAFADELEREFPHSLSTSDALRVAAEEAVQHRKARLTKADIRDAILEALDRA